MSLARRRFVGCAAAAAGLGLVPGLAGARPPSGVPPSGGRPTPVPGQPPTDLAVSHMPFGRVSPVLPVPDLPVTLDDGQAVRLRPWMSGRVTVMQLMFTGCSATCPIQGALFAEVARRQPHKDVRLLSFSIDALGDTPQALKAWMGRHGPHASWRAALPRPEDADRMLDFVRGRNGGADPHTAKVYFFDRKAQLVYKTPDLPSVRDILSLLDAAVKAR